MTPRWLIVPIVGLLALAACSGDDDNPTATSEPSSTTVDAATAGKAASVIARYRDDFTEALDFHQTCSGIDCFAAEARISRHLEMTNMAASIVARLDDLEPFEDEISDLAVDTIDLADGVVDYWEQEVAPCIESASSMEECADQFAEHEALLVGLADELDAWSPYL